MDKDNTRYKKQNEGKEEKNTKNYKEEQHRPDQKTGLNSDVHERLTVAVSY